MNVKHTVKGESEGNVRKSHDFRFGADFIDTTSSAQSMEEKLS